MTPAGDSGRRSGEGLPRARRDVLLVAADWQSRTLALAELEEAGYDVAAEPGIRYGVRALVSGQAAPSLILVDTQGDADATPEQVAGLLDMAPGAPAILVTGAYGRAAWAPLRPRLAALLHRPLTVDQIVAAVQRALRPL